MGKEVFKLEGLAQNNGKISLTGQKDGQEYLKAEARCSDAGDSLNIASELLKHALHVKNTDIPVVIEHDYLTSEKIPVLCYYPEGAEKLPIVFFVHGYTGDKISWDAGNCIKLAQQGFFTVILDARQHGERRPKDFDLVFAADRFVLSFFKVVKETSEDITRLLDHFSSDSRVDIRRAGMTGISMGGFTTFMTATLEKRIKAAAPMIGSPHWEMMLEYPGTVIEKEVMKQIMEYDPYSNFSKFKPTALLVQNGAEDMLVPTAGAKRLDEKLRVLYADMPERYKFIEYPGVAHETTPEMIDRVIGWFKKYL